MKPLVVDASVALVWCFPDEASAYADGALSHVARASMVVPAVWAVEISNALVVARRRKRLGGGEVRRYLDVLDRIEIRETSTDCVTLIGGLPDLAIEFGLTAYDACYLDLASRQDLPLATLDKRLRAAAAKAGVEVFAG